MKVVGISKLDSLMDAIILNDVGRGSLRPCGETEDGKKIRERESERLNRLIEEAHVAITENSEAPRDAPGDIEMVAMDGSENVRSIQTTNPTNKCDPETEMAKALYDPETEITRSLCQCWVDI